MKNKYVEYKKVRTDKLNAFPMMFAFNDKQFEEGKEKLGVKDDNELISIGFGGFIKKTDKEAFKRHLKLTNTSLKQFLKNDDNLFDAFVYELGNHEYCITYDLSNTLDVFGMTENTLTDKQRGILQSAVNNYLQINREG